MRAVRRRDFIAEAAGACAAAAWPEPAAPSSRRPNVVAVLTDDQRWDCLGFAGHSFLRTPHIDRLAREGAWFENAFATTPVCSPSRASFLTGQYAHAHGVKGNEDYNALSHQLVTFPRLLESAGYDTAYVGKWHMGDDDMPRPGFHHWASFRGQGDYNNPQLNINGKRVQAQGYITDLLTDEAVEFIRRPRREPFAVYLGHKASHSPFVPAPRHESLYRDEPILRRRNHRDNLDGKLILRRHIENYAAVGPGTGPGDDLIRNYLRTLAAVDESVGRLRQALEEVGQLDDTVFVFASDQGYFFGEHGLGDKRAAYEEAIRLPLIVRYPRLIRAGTRIKAMALNIDLAPTVLELAGVPVADQIQGRSLVPLLKGELVEWRRSFLAEYWVDPPQPRIPTWQAVRTERWKYIRYSGFEGMDEFYDLSSDPYEMSNLILDPTARPALEDTKREFERLLRETDCPDRPAPQHGRAVKLEGILINRWCAQTAKTEAALRAHTRLCNLTDGCSHSGFAIVAEGNVHVLSPESNKAALVLLEGSKRGSNLVVRAEGFLADGILRLRAIAEK